MNLNNFFEDLEKKSKQNIPKNGKDYIEKGLLYCGKCHTPKQGMYSIGGRIIKPYILCDCESKKYKKEQEIEKQKRHKEHIEKLRMEAFPDCKSSTDENMKAWTFDKDDKSNLKISQMAKRYVENFETFRKQGQGLLFYGTVGTGKTFISACIANALLDDGYRVLMTSFSRIENTVFSINDKQKYYDKLNKCDLLIVDDFGVERSSEYKQEIVYTVIDGRSKVNLPLIVTTNLTANELANPQGINEKRIFSRLLKMCHPIKIEGVDRRQKNMSSNFLEMQKILGI